MAEKKGYEYRVLVMELPGAKEFNAGTAGSVRFKSLGTFEARTPEDAVEQAGRQHDFPDGSELVAVALSNWHERVIAVETRRDVTARKKEPAGDA
jgi:hypothetical protein